jgi:hypothetical protein
VALGVQVAAVAQRVLDHRLEARVGEEAVRQAVDRRGEA